MSRLWDPERVVDVALARRLIRSQFPEIAARRVEPFGEGWDNTVFRVDDDRVFRFPRRQIAVGLLETECRVLPHVADRLPLPVSTPIHLGRASAEFAWPFAGYRRLPGRPACRLGLDDAARRKLAAPLGSFLAALHGIALEALSGTDVPGDTLGRMDPHKRLPQIDEILHELTAAGTIDSPDRWRGLVQDLPARDDRPRCLVHGDLYACHLLLDETTGRLTGIIDWGDVHLGDPAEDLMLVLAFLPAAARPEFARAYGTVDQATWRLAAFRALHHTLTVTRYAAQIGDRLLLDEARASLERLADLA